VALVFAAVVLVVAAVGGYAYGYFTGPDGGPEVPSPDQAQVLAEMGPPPEFLLTDGPIDVDGPLSRVEVWGYPDAGRILTFVDGILVDQQPTGDAPHPPASGFSPAEFHRSQRKGDVDALLGDAGTLLPETDTGYAGLESYAYDSARLLVSYLDGWLFVVQTY
jgi:hypothetical protein